MDEGDQEALRGGDQQPPDGVVEVEAGGGHEGREPDVPGVPAYGGLRICHDWHELLLKQQVYGSSEGCEEVGS